ncbi:TPA: Dam family site-specific DNA-(adenine-N6)-methyltransferase [Citrobacter koseri]|nr:Dam family site-specific DNA-(adenine-N6)-methyltransferase [Citrobacter koseri]
MIRSLVKWPGGKGRVMSDLLPVLPKGGCLVEPFVGGASVFLNTDYRRYILSDINPDLINLYRVARNYPGELISLSRDLFKNRNTGDDYAKLRAMFNHPKGRHLRHHFASVARAAFFLYLNRHGYNGIVRYNLQGEYNVPYGKGKHKKTQYLPEAEIRLFSEKALDTCALFLCCDFAEAINAPLFSDSVIYCDPPYLPASDTANFTQYHTGPFGEKQHRQLVAALLKANRETGASVVISNSDTPLTREIYKDFRFQEIAVQRSVSANTQNREKAKEVIGTLGIVEGCQAGGCGHCPDALECMGSHSFGLEPHERFVDEDAF